MDQTTTLPFRGRAPRKPTPKVVPLPVKSKPPASPTPRAKADDTIAVELPRLIEHRFEVTIKEKTPLIVHAWSEKARKEMRDKQQGRAKSAREPKDPKKEFEGAKYLDEKGRDCIPIMAIKNAMVNAARFADNMKMTFLRGAFFVENPEGAGRMLLPISFKKCVMREDNVRVGMGTADLRYRPEYQGWSAKFLISLNNNAITPEQILHMLQLAGYSIGLCEWRPEKDGPFGRFIVDA